MKNIIGVRFRQQSRIYFFDPGDISLEVGDHVIVETSQGQDYAEVVIAKREIKDENLKKPLKKIVRKSTKEDDEGYKKNKKREKEAFKICEKKIKEHELKMKLSGVDIKFDNSKVLFYFLADGRIDFRDLVKDLAAVYKTRIELRQVGARDEVRRIGGLGVCGRELCCCSYLNEFETISIKMAKDQNLSLNPTKISGNCGRLMCCLRYEENVYEEKLKKLPKIGAIVKTEDGEGVVDRVVTLKEEVRVKLTDENGDFYYKNYENKDVKVIKDSKVEEENPEEKANEKELKELEKLEKADNKLIDEEYN